MRGPLLGESVQSGRALQGRRRGPMLQERLFHSFVREQRSLDGSGSTRPETFGSGAERVHRDPGIRVIIGDEAAWRADLVGARSALVGARREARGVRRAG